MAVGDVTFILLGLTLATALLAPRLQIPAPVVFAAVGIGVGTAWHLVPALRAIRMQPELVLLIRESRGLLVGEGEPHETAAVIRAIAQQQPHIKKAGLPLTIHIGADDVLLALDVVFADSVGADDAAATVEQIERTVHERFPKVTRIYIESRHRIDLTDVAG